MMAFAYSLIDQVYYGLNTEHHQFVTFKEDYIEDQYLMPKFDDFLDHIDEEEIALDFELLTEITQLSYHTECQFWHSSMTRDREARLRTKLEQIITDIDCELWKDAITGTNLRQNTKLWRKVLSLIFTQVPDGSARNYLAYYDALKCHQRGADVTGQFTFSLYYLGCIAFISIFALWLYVCLYV